MQIIKKTPYGVFLYGVDKLPNKEPFDKAIVSKISLYSSLIHVMKQSTQEYYNMRLVLGLEVA